MHLFALVTLTSIAAARAIAGVISQGSLWVDEVPSYVRPYAIQRYNAPAFDIFGQTFRLPVTGPSSGGAFTLQQSNAPKSAELGVIPHIHKIHHENFYCTKGRIQLWTAKDGSNDTRVLSKADYGVVVQNTEHTFQYLEPDSAFSAIIFPGGFEELYYNISDRNLSFPSQTPFDPLARETGANIPLNDLERFDVYTRPNFIARQDAVDGAAPAGTGWHETKAKIPDSADVPYYVANDFGPKYLNSKYMGYHIVEPLIGHQQSDGNFTVSKISVSRLLPNITVPPNVFSEPSVMELLDGQLSVTVGKETVQLLEGDVIFLPAGTTFKYWSKVAFTRFMYFSAGTGGLGTQLVEGAERWDSPVWPIYAA